MLVVQRIIAIMFMNFQDAWELTVELREWLKKRRNDFLLPLWLCKSYLGAVPRKNLPAEKPKQKNIKTKNKIKNTSKINGFSSVASKNDTVRKIKKEEKKEKEGV